MWVKDKVSQSMINAVYSVLEAKVEPAAPDAEAIARRKKLQAIKDKQEDERAEKGTGIKGQDSVRTHKGTYGTEYKEEVEELDEISLKKSSDAYAARMSRAPTDKPGQVQKTSQYIANRYGSHGVVKAAKKAGEIGKHNVSKNDIHAHYKKTYEEVDLEQIEEAATRKDFQMVADLIRAHDSHDKRKELAGHHAAIFAQQNPRFDHHKFMKACGVTHEVYGEENDFYANFRNKLIESMGDKKSEVLDEIMDEEKDMSDSQKTKREKIVKSMKGKTAEFKKKYGARWKNVMYATATKLAMQEDYVVDESALEEAIDAEKKTTDTLAGRIKGGKENQHSSFKIKLKAEAAGSEEVHPDEAQDKKLVKKMVKKDCMKSEEVEIFEDSEFSQFHPNVNAELKKHKGKIEAIMHNTKDNVISAVVHHTDDKGLSGPHHVHFFYNNKKVHSSVHPTFGDAEHNAMHTITTKKGLMHLKKMHGLMKEEVEIDLDQYDLDDLQAFMESEEFNQLDELSKDTLQSYVHKSFAQGNELHKKISATTDPKERAKLKAQLSKRNTGVIKAAKKYTKEESSTWSFNEFVQTIEEGRVSPTAGTRKIKTYGEGQKHHAEVRHDSQWNDYQVHHYTDGKHNGEDQVSHHYDDKEDAHDTAKWEVERLNKMHKEETEVKQPTLAEQLAKETLYKALTKGN